MDYISLQCTTVHPSALHCSTKWQVVFASSPRANIWCNRTNSGDIWCTSSTEKQANIFPAPPVLVTVAHAAVASNAAVAAATAVFTNVAAFTDAYFAAADDDAAVFGAGISAAAVSAAASTAFANNIADAALVPAAAATPSGTSTPSHFSHVPSPSIHCRKKLLFHLSFDKSW